MGHTEIIKKTVHVQAQKALYIGYFYFRYNIMLLTVNKQVFAIS